MIRPILAGVIFFAPLVSHAEDSTPVIDQIYCNEGHALLRTKCEVIEKILQPQSCITFEANEGESAERVCVERKLEIDYRFDCEVSEDHGFGVVSNESNSIRSLFYVNESQLTIEGYGPFKVTDTDPELSKSARFGKNCRLYIDEVKRDISSFERIRLDLKLASLRDMQVVLGKVKSSGSSASLIVALIHSLDPNGLNNLLTDLRENLFLIESQTEVQVVKDKINSFIKEIDDYLSGRSTKNSLKVELAKLSRYYDEAVEEISTYLGEHLLFTANVLSFASDTTFVEVKSEYEQLCNEIIGDNTMCLLKKRDSEEESSN